MRRRTVGLVTSGLLAAALLAGCGDDGDDTLTKAGFLTRGNTACKASEDRIKEAANAKLTKGEIPKPDVVEAFAKETVIPELDKQVEALEELEAPGEDGAQVEDIITSARNASEEIDDDPTIIVSGPTNPLNEYSDRADGYGLKACAAAADRVSGVVTGKSSEFD